ncbi:hypothetical protein IT412_04790 [Candidatus Peregrinibacteria bacterium]|nr:hypothetical protein [Candidatus Peregrinibacteria bacterium]
MEFLSNPVITAIIGFLSAVFSQFLLQLQISKQQVRTEKIAYKKLQLENLKHCAEKMITEIMAYDEFANHIVTTINHGLHDEKKMIELSEKIKKMKDEFFPKLQIYFHELANFHNEYSMAVANFQKSFFEGLECEGLKQRGWKSNDIDRMKDELKELNKQKYILISETIKYLNKKEDSLF